MNQDKETSAATETGISATTNDRATSLHQEIVFQAAPSRIYEILLNSELFTEVSGAPAEISSDPGGTFSQFGGMIVGRHIELDPGVRIVQAWRPSNWTAGLYSLVKFELVADGDKTNLILDHSSFPAGGLEHLSNGWNKHYWEPLIKYLA